MRFMVPLLLAGIAAAHPDPSAKPASRLRLAQSLGDCLGCTLKASPAVLESDENGEAWVEVSVSGVAFGTASDWVGAFAPEDLTPDGAMLRFPIRWQQAGSTCGPRVPPPPPPPPGPAPPAASCAALGCSSVYNSSAPCSCTSSCHHFDDCCSDYDKVCAAAARTCVGDACCSPNNYLANGNATLRFKLVNLHRDYIFALVQGNAQYPSLVATSNPVAFAQPAEPTGIHLALTMKPHQMRVTWSAPPAVNTAARGDTVDKATARWGRAPGQFDIGTADATGSTYTRAQLCTEGGPATGLGWRNPPTIMTAVMDNLEAGVRYWYTVGSDGGGWSHLRRNFSFIAPAAAGGPTATHKAVGGRNATAAADGATTILAFGDMGKAPSAWDGSLEHSWDNPPGMGELGSWNTTKTLLAEFDPDAAGTPQAVLHIGDISYAVGYATEWDEFLAQVEPVASQVAWMTVDGNHERNCPCTVPPPSALAVGINWINGSDSGGECGVPYESRFPMPQPEADQPWYSVTAGAVAVVMMSTEHDFSVGSTQLVALERMLAAVDRSVTPWLLFGGHRPMYVDSKYPSPSEAPLQTQVEPLLVKYKVDLAMWGHHHSYHRTCPIKGAGKCASAGEVGVRHAVIGAAGYSFSPVATGADQPAWVEFASDSTYGYARLTANSTDFDFSFVRSDNGETLDGFSLSL